MFNMLSSREAGIAILFRRSLDIELKHVTSVPGGRILQVQAIYASQSLNLVNVYAPSGGSHVRERKAFFDSLET